MKLIPCFAPHGVAARCATGAALIACLAVSAPPATAAPAVDAVLPSDTVAYFSVADPDDFTAKWRRTQIGQFTTDPVLEPFVNQIRDQLVERFGNIEQRLGMTLDDVTAAAGGEAGVGMLFSGGGPASVAVVIDITGKPAEADRLVASAEGTLAKRGATRRTQRYAGVDMAVLSLPKTARRKLARDVVHFRHQDLLCAVDSVDRAQRMIDTLGGNGPATLAEGPAFAETMRRCDAESRGLEPDVRWFVSPFAWDAARRTLEEADALPDRTDTFTILRQQGFDAIRGIGGHIALAATPQQDVVHRTAVWAPGKPGSAGKPAAEKYELGMRMAELPNRRKMPVEPWAPRMTATYSTVNLDILNAYDHLPSLFDAVTGYAGAFQHTLDSFEVDPYGPEIEVRKQIIENLGRRVTIMTDYKLPIATDSERYLIVVEVEQPERFRPAFDKVMKNDAVEREVNGVEYWELVPEDEPVSSELNDDLLGGIDPIDDTGAGADEGLGGGDRVLNRAAVCLKGDQLIVASDVEFLQQVLFGIAERESLGASLDFRVAMQQLGKLASAERCSWSFLRTDESIRPSYELIRQGLMPQSQSFFGRFLNELLTTPEDEEQGIVRKQRVDGSRLPTFELARRYFGPAARAIRSDDDGWFITGVVLSKAGQ